MHDLLPKNFSHYSDDLNYIPTNSFCPGYFCLECNPLPKGTPLADPFLRPYSFFPLTYPPMRGGRNPYPVTTFFMNEEPLPDCCLTSPPPLRPPNDLLPMSALCSPPHYFFFESGCASTLCLGDAPLWRWLSIEVLSLPDRIGVNQPILLAFLSVAGFFTFRFSLNSL